MSSKARVIAQSILRAWNGGNGFTNDYMHSTKGKNIEQTVYNVLVDLGYEIDTVWWWRW